MIEEVLDGDFIKQQAENNSLDFQKYAAFVIDLMAKLAAPARDEMIQNITKLTNTVYIQCYYNCFASLIIIVLLFLPITIFLARKYLCVSMTERLYIN